MLVAHARVDDRDDDVRAAGRDRPGRLDVQRRLDLARGRAQVPLARLRAVAGHAGGVERVVRGADDPAALVGHGVLDVALVGEALGQLGRRDAAREHHLCEVRHGRPRAQGQPQPRAERRGAGRRRGRRRSRALALTSEESALNFTITRAVSGVVGSASSGSVRFDLSLSSSTGARTSSRMSGGGFSIGRRSRWSRIWPSCTARA